MYKARYDTLCNIRNGGDYPCKDFKTCDELTQSLADIWDTITILSLLCNGLNELPSTVGYWPRTLRHIYLGRSNLKRLSDKPGYWPDKLITISIPNNNIRVLPSTVGYWPARMMYLNIAHSSIQELPDNLLDCRWICKMISLDNLIISVSPEIKQWLQNK